MIPFMLDIRFNNNKAFMAANKAVYERLMRDPYHALVEALAPTLRQIDPLMELRPYKCLSRIYRDTRFSHDKSPYRDHHWLAFRRAAEPRDKAVMLWFEIRVEQITWGLGFWGENRPAMDVLRRRMLAHPDEIIAIVSDKSLRTFELEGDDYKRLNVPESLPEALHPWYVRKELFLIKHNTQDRLIFTPALADQLAKDFMTLAPMYRLLRGCYDLGQKEASSQ